MRSHRRIWLAVHVNLLHKHKFRRLSLEAKAALLHVWLIAGETDPEATWTSLVELQEIVELDGITPAHLDELIERHWLDVEDDGRVLVHGWDEHQWAASKAIQQAYERDRKQGWRLRNPRDIPPPSALPSPESETQRLNTGAGDLSGNVPDIPEITEKEVCPSCGKYVIVPENTVVDRTGQHWHRTCAPESASSSEEKVA